MVTVAHCGLRQRRIAVSHGRVLVMVIDSGSILGRANLVGNDAQGLAYESDRRSGGGHDD